MAQARAHRPSGSHCLGGLARGVPPQTVARELQVSGVTCAGLTTSVGRDSPHDDQLEGRRATWRLGSGMGRL